MKTIIEILKSITVLSIVIYTAMVVTGIISGDLMTFQWVMLLILILLWILIRILEKNTEEERYVDQNA